MTDTRSSKWPPIHITDLWRDSCGRITPLSLLTRTSFSRVVQIFADSLRVISNKHSGGGGGGGCSAPTSFLSARFPGSGPQDSTET